MNAQHNSGQTAELFVAFRLSELGYTVSRPFLTQCRYDLVFETDKVLWTVQVKKATWSKSGPFQYLQARLCRDKIRLEPDVDCFAFTDNKRVWVVHADDLKGMTSVCLDCTNPDYKSYKHYDPNKWLI